MQPWWSLTTYLKNPKYSKLLNSNKCLLKEKNNAYCIVVNAQCYECNEHRQVVQHLILQIYEQNYMVNSTSAVVHAFTQLSIFILLPIRQLQITERTYAVNGNVSYLKSSLMHDKHH